jgi:hypothetical protein
MTTWLAYKKRLTPLRAQPDALFLAQGLLALVLAACFGIFLGTGLAQASPQQPAVPASLTFTAPSTKGLIGGPPGAKTTVHGASWIAFSSVDLYVKPGLSSCGSGVSLGSFPTDANGSLAAHFLWPAGANRLDDYHVCGIQSGKGIVYSHNTFTVLASGVPTVSATPSSTIAGNALTVTGSNWLPGPQTVNLVILPCSSLCSQTAVANGQVVTAQDGSFSLQMTISANAPGGTYYIQAANGQATLSSVSPAIQVTGQGQPGGTPVPGISPTSVATRTSQGSGSGSTPPTANNTLPAIKAALVAAAIGIGVLAVLIGGGIFLIRTTRSEGAAKKGKNSAKGQANPERIPPYPAYGRAPARPNYAPNRPPPLLPVPGRVRQEPRAQEEESQVWEGESRTAPATFVVPQDAIYVPADEPAIPYVESTEPQRRNPGAETGPTMAPPAQGTQRPPAAPTFRPHRPEQVQGWPPPARQNDEG